MIRARRGLVLAFTALLAIALYLFSPWDGLFGGSSSEVNELYGLLHVVTSSHPENERILSDPGVNPLERIPWEVYGSVTPGVNWSKEAKRIDKQHPIIVFSKTYCPYSRKAKQLLASYDIHPPPKIIEVDTREDGMVLKTLLTRLTGHSTFPNVVVRGKTIGGSDNLAALHAQNVLRTIIEDAGAKAKGKGPAEDV